MSRLTRRAIALIGMVLVALSGSLQGEEIEVQSILLRLIEQADVPAQEAGMLTKIHVREGDMAKPGIALAQIDDANVILQRQRAEFELQIAVKASRDRTDVKEATEELAVAKEDYARGKESRDTFRKAISDAELSQLRLTEVRAQAKLDRALYELEVAALTEKLKEQDLAFVKDSLERRTIKSPISGMVVELLKNPGEWVEPGDKVARVVRLDRLRAEGFVSAQFTANALVGQPVRVTLDDNPSRTYPGRIIFVSPEIDPINRQARVWAEVENPDHVLLPGLRAKMVISVKSAPPRRAADARSLPR